MSSSCSPSPSLALLLTPPLHAKRAHSSPLSAVAKSNECILALTHIHTYSSYILTLFLSLLAPAETQKSKSAHAGHHAGNEYHVHRDSSHRFLLVLTPGQKKKKEKKSALTPIRLHFTLGHHPSSPYPSILLPSLHPHHTITSPCLECPVKVSLLFRFCRLPLHFNKETSNAVHHFWRADSNPVFFCLPFLVCRDHLKEDPR